MDKLNNLLVEAVDIGISIFIFLVASAIALGILYIKERVWKK